VPEGVLHDGETLKKQTEYEAKNWKTGRGYKVTGVQEGLIKSDEMEVGTYLKETYLGVEPNKRGHW